MFACRYVAFDELLRRSDIVTVHVPNQPSTNGRLTGESCVFLCAVAVNVLELEQSVSLTEV